MQCKIHTHIPVSQAGSNESSQAASNAGSQAASNADTSQCNNLKESILKIKSSNRIPVIVTMPCKCIQKIILKPDRLFSEFQYEFRKRYLSDQVQPSQAVFWLVQTSTGVCVPNISETAQTIYDKSHINDALYVNCILETTFGGVLLC